MSYHCVSLLVILVISPHLFFENKRVQARLGRALVVSSIQLQTWQRLQGRVILVSEICVRSFNKDVDDSAFTKWFVRPMLAEAVANVWRSSWQFQSCAKDCCSFRFWWAGATSMQVYTLSSPWYSNTYLFVPFPFCFCSLVSTVFLSSRSHSPTFRGLWHLPYLIIRLGPCK